MEYRTLGRTGIEVSLISLGTMTNKALTKAHT
jgi:aryl-alcohol dehydrogenase-like predicted oxidoreductase